MAEVPIPTLRRSFLEVVFHFLVNDIVFYFLHGLLHTPYFYKRIHKIHHEFKAPVALAARRPASGRRWGVFGGRSPPRAGRRRGQPPPTPISASGLAHELRRA